jgi:hypothetical protein
MTKLTREQRLAAREADVTAAPTAKVVDVVLVVRQKVKLCLPDGNVAMMELKEARGGYARIEFTKG